MEVAEVDGPAGGDPKAAPPAAAGRFREVAPIPEAAVVLVVVVVVVLVRVVV